MKDSSWLTYQPTLPVVHNDVVILYEHIHTLFFHDVFYKSYQAQGEVLLAEIVATLGDQRPDPQRLELAIGTVLLEYLLLGLPKHRPGPESLFVNELTELFRDRAFV